MPVLPAHAALQVPAEIPLVDAVLAPLDRLHAVFELDHRRDRRERLHLGKVALAELARQLHGDVAAERVAGDGEARQPVAIAQLVQHEQRIRRQPRVIQAARQVFGAAAITLIEPHHVKAGREAPCRRVRACSALRSSPRGRAAPAASARSYGPAASCTARGPAHQARRRNIVPPPLGAWAAGACAPRHRTSFCGPRPTPSAANRFQRFQQFQWVPKASFG